MTVLIFDTETTGLADFKLPADAPGQPRLCAIAARLLTYDPGSDGYVSGDGMFALIKPDGWDPEVIEKAGPAFSVNGLSVDLLERDGIPVAEALAMYDGLVDQCEGIAAYGVAFDQKMVRAEQRRAGRPDRYGERPTFDVQHACTKLCNLPPTEKMQAAGRHYAKTPTLAEAYGVLIGEPLDGAHQVDKDLEATIRLFQLLSGKNLVTFKDQVSKR
jgi:DNA polymerase-3 subunit epsilon